MVTDEELDLPIEVVDVAIPYASPRSLTLSCKLPSSAITHCSPEYIKRFGARTLGSDNHRLIVLNDCTRRRICRTATG